MPDRQRQNLRGPVSSCTEWSTYSTTTDAEGVTQNIHLQSTTKYDAAGRVLSRSNRQLAGSDWVTRDTYDPSGRLLNTASGIDGQPMTETVYSYNHQGRLQSIVNGAKPDSPITFHYDEMGRKTKIEISRPEDYRPNVASGGGPFAAADRAPNLLGGGTAITTYDAQDRPTEVQVRDSNGDLMNRAVRIYDEQGNVTEERQILDYPERMFPPETRAKMLEESGLSADRLDQELRAQITKLMSGQTGPFSVAYSYDTQGRLAVMHRRIFNSEQATETTYNEHGDVALEITRDRPLAGESDSKAPSLLPPYSEACYSYKYDDHGNWVEQSVTYRSSPDGEFQPPTVTARTLTYY